MNDKSTNMRLLTEGSSTNSSIFHVSVEGWMALTVTGACCYMGVTEIPITEPMYGAFMLILGSLLSKAKKTPSSSETRSSETPTKP